MLSSASLNSSRATLRVVSSYPSTTRITSRNGRNILTQSQHFFCTQPKVSTSPFSRIESLRSSRPSYSIIRLSTRSLSSNNTKPPPKNDGNAKDETSQELVLTPGEKVVAGTRLTVYAGLFALAGCCAFYIGKELFPTKMSPNSVFDRAFNVIRESNEVKRRFGEPLKAYGRDHGGHREGRRNFIEHTEYKDKEDGSNRTRVRFNLEGQFGTAFVFAEVSSDMPSGDFVYILVQDKRNGQVINVVDNRSSLLAQRMAGGSNEGRQALQNLLGGGSSSSR